jgi:hypothetical protein
MSNGGFIGKRIVPSTLNASGVWNINEASLVHGDGIWPLLIATVVVDYLMIGGGGGGGFGTSSPSGYAGSPGGGAGGYLNSYGSEASGGNSASASALQLLSQTNYSIAIGAGGAANTNGSDTTLSGINPAQQSFTVTADGGGAGAAPYEAGHDGGSGGGGEMDTYSGQPTNFDANDSAANNGYLGGSATTNQGHNGGQSKSSWGTSQTYYCGRFGGGWCTISGVKGAGGGGAGGVGDGGNEGGTGGAGLASSITGSSVTRAAGGSGRGQSNAYWNVEAMPTGSGSSSPGGGGEGGNNSGGDGILVLRYPNTYTVSNPGGGLTLSSATDGNDKVTIITAGTGNIRLVAS